jgi:hypothetical protein
MLFQPVASTLDTGRTETTLLMRLTQAASRVAAAQKKTLVYVLLRSMR